MKKRERKVLKEKLFTAIEAVIKNNKDEFNKKTEKAIRKSIKQIVKKTSKIKKVASLKDTPIKLNKSA